jgi:hypothetical protein
MTKPKQEEIKPALRQAQTGPVVPKAGAASLSPAIVTIQSAQEKDIPNLAGLNIDSIWNERRQAEAEPESVLRLRQHWRNTRLRHERSQRIHTFGASSPMTRSEDDILFTKEAVFPRAGSSPIEARSLATAGCLTMVRQSDLFCALHRHTRLVAAQQRLALAMRLLSKNQADPVRKSRFKIGKMKKADLVAYAASLGKDVRGTMVQLRKRVLEDHEEPGADSFLDAGADVCGPRWRASHVILARVGLASRYYLEEEALRLGEPWPEETVSCTSHPAEL